MYISHLTIRNFKGFESFELSFEKDEKANIIYGINAAGKTTILEALGIAVGSFFLELIEVEKRVVNSDEVRLATKLGKLEYQFPVKFFVEGNALKTDFNFIRTENSFSGGLDKKDAKQLSKLSKKALEIVRDGKEEILPIIAYFSCKRLFQDRKKSTKGKQPIGRFMGYYNALNDSSITKEIERWFIDETATKFNEAQTGNTAYENEGLKLMYNTLLDVFPKKYESVYFFKPTSDDRLTSGLFFKDEKEGITSLQMMSDGYRNTYSLILEIAWRCYQLNPFLKQEATRKTNGVVLIDEIDLHLHPEIQQQIIGILRRIFPSIQFVFTTHSPIVLGSTEATVWKFEQNQLKKQSPLFGKSASAIIKYYMDAYDRAPEVKTLIKRYFELINNKQGNSDEAKQLRDHIENIDPAIAAEGDTLIQFI